MLNEDWIHLEPKGYSVEFQAPDVRTNTHFQKMYGLSEPHGDSSREVYSLC